MPKRSARTPHPEAADVIAAARKGFVSSLGERLAPGEIDAAADWLGSDRSTLYRWKDLGDDRQPGLFHAAALARFLGISLDQMIGAAPSAPPPDLRELLDNLRRLPTADRTKIVAFSQWVASTALAASGQSAATSGAPPAYKRSPTARAVGVHDPKHAVRDLDKEPDAQQRPKQQPGRGHHTRKG